MTQVQTSTGHMPGPAEARPGKYLTYRLGGEQYGLEIMKVQEIIGLMPMTRIPRTPECVRGVINLRGKVIPIVDLRIKFGLEQREDTRKTCIVVMQIMLPDHTAVSLGVVVDEVAEVIEFAADQLQPQPSVGTRADLNIILGIGRVGERIVMLLDADRLVTADEISVVDSVS